MGRAYIAIPPEVKAPDILSRVARKNSGEPAVFVRTSPLVTFETNSINEQISPRRIGLFDQLNLPLP